MREVKGQLLKLFFIKTKLGAEKKHDREELRDKIVSTISIIELKVFENANFDTYKYT